MFFSTDMDTVTFFQTCIGSFYCFMVVMMVVTTAAFLIFIMVVVTTAALFVFIMVVVTTAAFTFLFFRESVCCMCHCIIDGLACQLFPWSCDDMCFMVEFMNDMYILMQYIMCAFLCSGKNDTCRCCDLIIKEFLEILMVNLTSFCIDNSRIAVAFQTFYGSDNGKNV